MNIFYLFLAVCLLIDSCFFYYFAFPEGCLSRRIEQEVIQIDVKINTTLNQEEFSNWTVLQKLEYRNETFKKMIDWGIQRQLTWAVMILTFLTLCFMILFEIKQKITENTNNICLYVGLLFIAEVLFSVSSFFSIYMVIRQYYNVMYLEERLLISPIKSPLTTIIGQLPTIILLINVVVIVCCVMYTICNTRDT